MPEYPGLVNQVIVGSAVALESALLPTEPPPPLNDASQQVTETSPANPPCASTSHVRFRESYAARLFRPQGSEAPEDEMSSADELYSVLNSIDPSLPNQHARRVTSLLPWMTNGDLQECLERLRGTPEIMNALGPLIDQTTGDERCFQWLRFLAVASQAGIAHRDDIKKLLERILKKIKADAEKEWGWHEENQRLMGTLGLSPLNLNQGKVNRSFQEVRSSLWKIGCPLFMIDRLINESSRDDHYRQIAYWMFDLWSSGWSAIRKVIGLQYMADRIAAAGDVVLGLYILQDPNRSLEDLESIRGGRFIRTWFSDHEKGFASVMKVANAPSEDMIERAIDAYSDPGNYFLPPVHGLIRELRIRASENAYRVQESALHRAAGKLLRACILGPIFHEDGQHGARDTGLENIPDQLVEGMCRGDRCSPEEWAGLMSEAIEALLARHRYEAAHDFLRAMYKLALCPDRSYSNLRLNLVSHLEITMHGRKNAGNNHRLQKICRNLTAWKIE